jgi:hypothetical protein
VKVFTIKLISLVFFLFIKVLNTPDVYSSDEPCSSNNVTVTKVEFVQTSPNIFDIYLVADNKANNAFTIQLVFEVGGIQHVVCVNRNSNLVSGIRYLFKTNYHVIGLTDENDIKGLKVQWHTTSNKDCNEPFNDDQCSTPNPQNIILPVIWHKFSTKLAVDFKSVELRWSTLKEWESSHFEVERSLNGIASFEKIGEEKSAGWSDTEVNYSFLDRTLPAGGSRLYYRIKQVDFDGTTDYSPTQMVELPMSNTNLGWQAYPNPTQNNRLFLKTLAYVRNRENPITIKLYTIDSAHSFIFQTYDSEMDLSSYLKKLPKGLVIIEISNTYSVEFLKVIHQ